MEVIKEVVKTPAVRWFSMHVDGEWKIAKVDNHKKMKIKKKKLKPVSNF